MREFLKAEYRQPIEMIYFIGIGGSSLSGLAEMAIGQGFRVEGSDINESDYTRKLQKLGALVHKGHHSNQIHSDIGLVVYSAAIHEDNPERQQAKILGIPQVERSHYLGLLSRVFPQTIGVAGTHGKTTTSSMIGTVMLQAGYDPSISIGSRIDALKSNARLGESDYFIVESCEYVDSFLETQHQVAIITNIEAEHLDYFTEGLPQIQASFRKFASIVPESGLIIAWGDSQEVLDAIQGITTPIWTFGFDEKNKWRADDITFDDQGNPQFNAYKDNQLYGSFTLKVPGNYNVLNALACIACCDYYKVPLASIQNSLKDFGGAKRRFQFCGEANGVNVYEDYAHHPTELKVVIEACRNHKHRKLWVVFQPYIYSRTYYLLDGFVDSLAQADFLVLNDISSDREENRWDIYSEDIAKRIKAKYQTPTVVFSKFETIVKFLADNVEEGDLVLVAGAYNINQVAYRLVEVLKEKETKGE